MFNYFQYFTGSAYQPYSGVIPQQSQSQTPQVQKKQKKKYNLIDDEKRELFIKLTQEQNLPIKQASETLNIKLSTSKAILKIFKKTGRTSKIKERKKKIFKIQKEKRVKHISPLEQLRKQMPKLNQEFIDPYFMFYIPNIKREEWMNNK